MAENIDPDGPLHDRLLTRYQDTVDIITGLIRRGRQAGRYCLDMDVTVLARDIASPSST